MKVDFESNATAWRSTEGVDGSVDESVDAIVGGSVDEGVEEVEWKCFSPPVSFSTDLTLTHHEETTSVSQPDEDQQAVTRTFGKLRLHICMSSRSCISSPLSLLWSCSYLLCLYSLFDFAYPNHIIIHSDSWHLISYTFGIGFDVI